MNLLDALLDSWDRNNHILTGFLRLIPADAFDIRPVADSPSVGELFGHMHYVRLVFVEEDAPEFAKPLPEAEWRAERNVDRLLAMFEESALAVREAVGSRLANDRAMDQHYDHPLLMLQHLIWHEGYHQGQIKLALKLAGRPIANDDVGPVTWSLWMRKKLATHE